MVNVQYAGQRHGLLAVNKHVGVDLAGGEATGDGHKVFQYKLAGALVYDAVDHVWDGYSFHGVKVHMASHVGYRLEDDTADGRMIQTKFQNGAYFVHVHAALNGGHQHGVDALLGQPV